MIHSPRQPGWKILTHDYCSPIQGGPPVWDGTTLPFTLPLRGLDTSKAECGAGWNYCNDLAVAFKIGGFWPTGRPSVALVVEPAADALARGDKRRASGLTLLRLATAEEISVAIDRFSLIFGVHAQAMADEQRAWRLALDRPRRDAAAVERALAEALGARGLKWGLKLCEDAAWDARAARDAWDAWDARDAWAAWDARDAGAARDARSAWAAWAAWAARAALTVMYASLQKWIDCAPGMLTVGLREAYGHGLEAVAPVAKNTLGWAMTCSR